MGAKITRLRTRKDRLRADQAEQLRLLILDQPGLPDRAVGQILATLDRETAAENRWTFVMMSAADNARVVRWLRRNSAYPVVAPDLWAELFTVLRLDTGEIMQTRDELATAVETTPRTVSRVMSELESIGAIIRHREGRGVRYYMSPRIGTHLTGAARDAAQAAAPKLATLNGNLLP
ncbi:helix-turn-helix domain-containing protein [Roseomonas sp. GCM10028921]